MAGDTGNTKIKDIRKGGSSFAKYRGLVHGDISLCKVIRNELLGLLFGYIPGPIGLALRKWFFPCMFAHCGRGVVFGRAVSFRHAGKIWIGDGVIIDDNAMVDAKGTSNAGIRLEDGVYIGRETTIYCKNGDIILHPRVNVSSKCTLFSSNRLEIGAGCMIGAYSYFLSGGEYDYRDPHPFADQSGMCTKGPLKIGDDCWFGTRVTILDGAQSIGSRCTVAACALVLKPVPDRSLVVGVPGRVVANV